MHDIFISYRRCDQALAGALVSDLEAQQVRVWWDQKIEGGTDWRDAIAENLEAADTLVILFSDDCNNSKQLRKELAVADALDKTVIPVLIEDTKPRGHFLYELASRNWIRLFPNPSTKISDLANRLVVEIDSIASPAGEPVSPAPTLVVPASPAEPRPQPASAKPVVAKKKPALKKRRDFMPFKWYELALCAGLGGLAAYGEGASSPSLSDFGFAFMVFLWIYATLVFPIRYFVRGRRLRRAVGFHLLSTGLLALISVAVVMLSPSLIQELYTDAAGTGEAAVILTITMTLIWFVLGLIAFVLYALLFSARAMRNWQQHVEVI